MEKLVEKFRDIDDRYDEEFKDLVLIVCAEEAKDLAIAFSKYIRLNDYLPQLLEDGDIGYVKSNEIWRADSPAEVYSKDIIFNKFVEEYYK